jgi:uncharacterized protein YndB with AHSA1/START domain
VSATESHLDGDQLIATRRLAAPVDLVWKAFTTPGHLAAFWGGDHATIPAESVTVDLRVGGTFELETRAVGSPHPGRRLVFRYEQIHAPNFLVLTEPLSGLVTTIRLESDRDHTVITVHQNRLPPELRNDEARLGLAGILDALAHVVSHHLDHTPNT